MSNFFAIFLQSLCIKLGTVTGLNLAENYRAHLPKWLNYFLYALAEAAIIATDVAEVSWLYCLALSTNITNFQVITGHRLRNCSQLTSQGPPHSWLCYHNRACVGDTHFLSPSRINEGHPSFRGVCGNAGAQRCGVFLHSAFVHSKHACPGCVQGVHPIVGDRRI
jgi:hypothetical protein